MSKEYYKLIKNHADEITDLVYAGATQEDIAARIHASMEAIDNTKNTEGVANKRIDYAETRENTTPGDTGKRINYGEGTAIREPAEGKGRFDLLSPFALTRIAKRCEFGAKKYGNGRNWEKGMPYSRYLDSALRHITQFTMGKTDEDHLAAACWNLMCIMHHQDMYQVEFNDIPDYISSKCDTSNDEDKTIIPVVFVRSGKPIGKATLHEVDGGIRITAKVQEDTSK